MAVTVIAYLVAGRLADFSESEGMLVSGLIVGLGVSFAMHANLRRNG